jgi:hypothetical protein
LGFQIWFIAVLRDRKQKEKVVGGWSKTGLLMFTIMGNHSGANAEVHCLE